MANYSKCISALLKESLHTLSIKIVFFEINHLDSLGYRAMITKEKHILKVALRVYLCHNIQQL